MSKKESVKNWVIIFAVLVLTSLAAAVWPLVAHSFSGSSASVSAPTEIQSIPLPFPVFSMTETNGFVIVAVLAVLMIGAIVVVGGGIGMAYLFLARQTDTVKESKQFQGHVAALTNLEKERIQQLRGTRSAGPIPDHNKLRWSVVSTSLITLLLVYTAVVIVNNAIIPAAAHIQLGSFALSTRLAMVVSSLLLTLLILAGRMRVERFANMDKSDNGPIPWDTIWVILTGLIVVGLGVGFLVYLNIPG